MEDQIDRYIEKNMINVGKGYEGHLLGHDDLSDCKFLRIDEADKIVSITTESDKLHFRKMRVKLASRDEEYVYGGYDNFRDGEKIEHKFDFDRKVDIVGRWERRTPGLWQAMAPRWPGVIRSR